MENRQKRWAEICGLSKRWALGQFWRDLTEADLKKIEGIGVIVVSVILYVPDYFFVMPLGHMNRLVGTAIYIMVCLFWILVAFFG
ncbi:hypothetical protein LDB30_06575 [Acidithiobacillus ferrooxidans]|nr:hypothetical protein LDB30_06575 [Acidithiobacillus ferrooxidans]